MRIVYIANARIPTEKAYGINMAKTCEALGERVSLLVYAPKRVNSIKETLFEYYGLKQTFIIDYLPIIDAVGRHVPLGFWINQITFTFSVFVKLLFKNRKKNIMVTRDELSGWLLSQLGFRVFYDMHGFPEHKVGFWKIAMRSMRGIFVTNRWKIGRLRDDFGIREKLVALAPNGFDPRLSNTATSKEEARHTIGLPQNKKIILYSGHLYDWKGAHILIPVAQKLTNPFFVLVGGTEEEIREFKKKYSPPSNMEFVGQQPYVKIPLFLKAADILVLPNSVKTEKKRFAVYSKFDTSPIKMFEYMASGVPILASDLPTIKETLHETNAFFAEPDNPESFAEGITRIFEDYPNALRKGIRAKLDVQNYTWSTRASVMIHFIQERL